MKTIVAKFGGTSLADAGQFRKVRAIIESDPARRFVVASAPGKRFSGDIKVTDLLLLCYEHAMQGKDVTPDLKVIRDRFQDILDELEIEFPLDEEMEIIRKNLHRCPQKEYMASRGEYLNSRILAKYLGFTFVDPEWCVCFQENGELDDMMTRRAFAAALKPLEHAVIAGFYGSDSTGLIRTFSRGGSDITGSLAARAVEADIYENWTDVSGLLAADPRIVDSPVSVDYLSYRELRILSYMGASVLHSDACRPTSKSGIPINIRNTNRPEDPGSMIVNHLPKREKRHRSAITGVTGRCGMSVIHVEKVMTSDGSGFGARMLDILKNRKIPFEQCLTGIDTITLVIRSDLFEPVKASLLEEIRQLLHPDDLTVQEGLSMIAVVGESDTESVHATMEILQAISAAGIEIKTINQGAGNLNLLIGVDEDKYKDAIRAVYAMISQA